METIVFENQEKVKAISLNTLKKTASLAEYSGSLPKTRPIDHYRFIEMVMERLDKKNYPFQLEDIWVTKQQSKRIMLLDPKNEGKPASYLFQRLITRILLRGDLLGKETGGAIAIGYTDKGLQLSFGTNVHICSNMCIFGGRIMTTYCKSYGVPFDKMVELMDGYIDKLPEVYNQDSSILNQMLKKQIKKEDLIQTVGDMAVGAVNAAYFGGDFPLNISQVSLFSKGLIKHEPKLVETGDLSKKLTVYDLYNMGTATLKPETADIVNVIPNNARWGNFINNRFNIDVPMN